MARRRRLVAVMPGWAAIAHAYQELERQGSFTTHCRSGVFRANELRSHSRLRLARELEFTTRMEILVYRVLIIVLFV
jgi:DNA-binding transcriptional regulator YhcF (GntR family)